MPSPSLSLDSASKIASELFEIEGSAISLGSCQDANFKIKSKDGDFVLKVSNCDTTKEELIFQNNVIIHLNNSKCTYNLNLPRLIKMRDCTDHIAVYNIDGTNHYIRMLTYVKGNIFSDYSYLSCESLNNFGEFVAITHNSLSSYSNPIVERHGEWDMQYSHENIESRIYSVADLELRNKILTTATAMQNTIDIFKSEIRKQIIHGDLAYYNVIANPGRNGRPIVSGVIDFGDVTESYIVGDLSIAIVPLFIMEDKPILQQTLNVLKGYKAKTEIPLTREEIICMWPFIVLRAILLYVSISKLLVEDPSNTYLQDEIVLNTKILNRVLEVPFSVAKLFLLFELGVDTVNSDNFNISHLILHQKNEFHELNLDIFSEINNDGSFLEEITFKKKFLELIEHSPKECIKYISYRKPIFSLGAKLHAQDNNRPSIPLGCQLYFTSDVMIKAPFDCELIKIGNDCSDKIHVHVNGNLAAIINMNPATRFILKGVSHSILVEGNFIFKSSGSSFNKDDIVGTLSYEIDSDYVSNSFWIQNICTECFIDLPTVFLPPKFSTPYEWSVWCKVCRPVSLFDNSNEEDNQNSIALSTRYAYYASIQQHYYKLPPDIERGFRQYMFDVYGRCYLDMVNNVAVIGHSHPAITAAITKQIQVLNTNSRFIYSLLGKFCEKIISKIPETLLKRGKLNRVFLVNSGSEATDLALRIARTVVTERRRRLRRRRKATTDDSPVDEGEGEGEDEVHSLELQRDVICLEGAYHGVTTASDEVSTTLNDNPRALESRAPWIHLTPMPNLYRGRIKHHDRPIEEESEIKIGESYAEFVNTIIDNLNQSGRLPSAFICEPLSGNAGGVEIPRGYLAKVYDSIHNVGGLCISDEVQVGYGRLGNYFWGFQEHGVEPDIITMAKAAGNGTPLGFVVTSAEIADEFGVDGSFFSSAGGGPVSCAVGLAVLETIERESLQENAKEVGNYLNQKLWNLKESFSIIGTIHGHGLYQGVELVKDSSGKPATEEAYAICERLLELGVICHNTGDYSNVLKVKPPLCFNKKDADFFVDMLRIALTSW